MTEVRFVVGIDLGTSNSALAYAELAEVRRLGRPVLHELDIPQLVAPGDVQARRLLPSALYVPAGFELDPAALSLPWGSSEAPVGEAARRLGAKTPVRLIESAKSWLCHGGVNRTAPILPWHAPEEVKKRSPVEVSTAFLLHLKAAWDHQKAADDPENRLEHQQLVITVPASFDEVARRLTEEAAKKAGLTATLIEEPLAAFYAFVARTGGTKAMTGLSGGEKVLIADVGGGTSDFTLIEVKAGESEDAPLGFQRTAVGDHLLLGGDNMDLALAHAIEGELTQGKKLDAEGWAQLRLECRLAKEALYTHLDRESLPIAVAGRGSKLIGGTLRATLTRARLEEVILEGYFPKLPAGEAALPKKTRPAAGFSEYGLPYAGEPAITRHLAAFLLRHQALELDAILYNGGALKPVPIRERIGQVTGEWLRQSAGHQRPDPRPLVYDEGDDTLEMAVARGAAYFGLVRAGLGVRVGGGSPRTYFLGVEGATLPEGKVQVLCIAPRGMQDGQRVELQERELQLVTNRPVEFPLYTTTAPEAHPVGALLELDREALVNLPPLQTVVKFGKQKAGTKVPVHLQVLRTDLGHLEVSCFSRMSGARFKLEFQLNRALEARANEAVSGERGGGVFEQPFGGAGTKAPPEMGDVPPEKLEAAKVRILSTFKKDPPRLDPDALMKGLEADLGLARDAFPLPTLRTLSELLLELMEMRGLSAELEARWLNVVGFCLRPGFGVPLDDWRVRQLWKIHAEDLRFPGREPNELNWWILWRRVAGGLGRGHQEELASRVFPLVVPSLQKRAKRKLPKPKSQEAAEVWRAAAALENLSGKSRAQLGDALVEQIEEGKAPKGALWCLARIGARSLLYGPKEATVRADTAAGWAKRLMAAAKRPKDEHPALCLVSLARLTGDRALDLDEPTRRAVAEFLVGHGVPDAETRPLFELTALDRATQGQAFGEGLPVGLTL